MQNLRLGASRGATTRVDREGILQWRPVSGSWSRWLRGADVQSVRAHSARLCHERYRGRLHGGRVLRLLHRLSPGKGIGRDRRVVGAGLEGRMSRNRWGERRARASFGSTIGLCAQSSYSF
jgi:hypothetical protein